MDFLIPSRPKSQPIFDNDATMNQGLLDSITAVKHVIAVLSIDNMKRIRLVKQIGAHRADGNQVPLNRNLADSYSTLAVTSSLIRNPANPGEPITRDESPIII